MSRYVLVGYAIMLCACRGADVPDARREDRVIRPYAGDANYEELFQVEASAVDEADWVTLYRNSVGDGGANDANVSTDVDCPKVPYAAGWVDVNALVKHIDAKGKRVVVAGRIAIMSGMTYLVSSCRANQDMHGISLRLAGGDCAHDGMLVVVDARLDDMTPATRARQGDGVDAELLDGRVVAYPSASQLCNYARSHSP